MTKLSNHQSGQTTKLLLIGDSGAGKTGALASLAGAGYNLWIADMDNGLDVLSNLLLSGKSTYPKEAADRVHFSTITDPMKQSGGKLIPTKAYAWQKLSKTLSGDENWGDEGKKRILDLTDQDVFVLDSLTFASKAALQFVLNMNARLGQKPFQSDWYEGQLLVEALLEMLYDESVKCNIVVLSHITYIGEDNGPQIGYPSSLGKSLSPKIGRYFNTILHAKTTGFGANQKRKIFTNAASLVELKTGAPLNVQKEYPLETGLADFFKDVRIGASPAPVTSAAPAPTAETKT